MVSQMDKLLTHLGTGRWSVLHLIVVAYGYLVLAPSILGGAFLAPRLDYSCRVPDNSTFQSSNIRFSIPLQTNASFFNSSNSFNSEEECEYSIESPDGETIVECLEFDFDNSTFSSTVTSEYNLACSRGYLQISFQSLYMFGVFMGAPFTGYFSDKYGRKFMLVIGYTGFLVLGLVSAWLPLLSAILVARFFMGCLHALGYFTSFVLALEMLEPRIRTHAAFGINLMWAGATMLYGVWGYLIRDWRILQTVLMLPGLLLLPGLWMIDESPRWMIVNDRFQEAIQVLSKVARWHGVELPPEADLKKLLEEQAEEFHGGVHHTSIWTILKSAVAEFLVLFRTPTLRTITLSLYVMYCLMITVYFGLSMSGVSLSNDPFLYMILMGLTEAPAYAFSGVLVERFGRKSTVCTSTFIAAIVVFAIGVIPAAYTVTLVVLATIGKMTITTGFQSTIFFSGELFPTEVRSRGMNTSFMISGMGGMMSPFVRDLVGSYYPWAPYFIFGSSALIAGGLTFLLPETRGHVLPDTVAELEARHRKTSTKQRRIPLATINGV